LRPAAGCGSATSESVRAPSAKALIFVPSYWTLAVADNGRSRNDEPTDTLRDPAPTTQVSASTDQYESD
jgi:hypothetical protein